MPVLILSAACASTTQIRSIPTGAQVYIDGEAVGRTPYTHSDVSPLWTSKKVELKLAGYQDFSAVMQRSEEPAWGALIGGAFFFVPWLWATGYKAEHVWELSPQTLAR